MNDAQYDIQYPEIIIDALLDYIIWITTHLLPYVRCTHPFPTSRPVDTICVQYPLLEAPVVFGIILPDTVLVCRNYKRYPFSLASYLSLSTGIISIIIVPWGLFPILTQTHLHFYIQKYYAGKRVKEIKSLNLKPLIVKLSSLITQLVVLKKRCENSQ